MTRLGLKYITESPPDDGRAFSSWAPCQDFPSKKVDHADVALHRLEAVAHVGEGAGGDDRECVVGITGIGELNWSSIFGAGRDFLHLRGSKLRQIAAQRVIGWRS